MSSSLENKDFELKTPPPALHWRSWPLRRELGHGVWLGFWIVLVGVIVWRATLSWGWGIFAAAIMTLSFWRFFIPIWFDMSSSGVSLRLLGWKRRLAWRSIGHYEELPSGVMLYPASKSFALLTTLQGLFIPWDEQRETILSHLSYYLGKSGGNTN